MEVKIDRSVDPHFYSFGIEFDATDFDDGFTNQSDPDEVNHYSFFGPSGDTDPISTIDKLQNMIALIKQIEAYRSKRAVSLGTKITREDKGKNP